MSFHDSMVISFTEYVKACNIERSRRRGTRKRPRGDANWELVDYDSLPDYLKDNEFILGYYRCKWPMKQTILSLFSIHNETLNVWTHLIGFLIFLCLTVITATMIPRYNGISSTAITEPQIEVMGYLSSALPEDVSSWYLSEFPSLLSQVKDDVTNMIPPLAAKPTTRWPFFAYLGGTMFCLLASSICHLTLCHCERTAYIMLRLDYAGISVLVITSFYPLVYYSFMCNPFVRSLYMGFITVIGAATILASLVPMFHTPEFRPLRSALFFCIGFSGFVPMIHKLIAFSHRPEAILTAGYELLMGIFYALGVVVYAMRIPERWIPGKFDLVGHSHQLFHVLVIAGAYTYYLACLVYLQWRDSEGC